jgi:HEAT repeat protein
LIEALERGSSHCSAARILGLAGVNDPFVITSLRRNVVEGKDEATRDWCARALGYLGDFDWLLSLTTSPRTVNFAVHGCCANLIAFRERGAQRVILDYTPLERLLDQAPDCAAAVEETISPGRSFCDIGNSDIPEALRGVASPHVSVRRHAICVLDNRRLKKNEFPKIVEALRPCMQDADQKVRFLAKLTVESLGR